MASPRTPEIDLFPEPAEPIERAALADGVELRPRRSKRRLVILIFAILVIDGVIGSLVFPVFPEFTKTSKHPEVWFQVGVAVFALMQFVCAPLLGRLSDRVGRRPVFRLAAIGTLGSLFLLLPVRLPLFIANRFADGSTNGLYAVVKSAIVDVSEPEDVQKNVGLSVSLSYVGFAVGPAFAFLVLKLADWKHWSEVRSIVLAGIVFAVINVVFSFMVPETRPVAAAAATAVTAALPEAVPDEKWRSALAEVNPLLLAHRIVTIKREKPMIARLLLAETMVAFSLSYYQYVIIFLSKGPLKLNANGIALMFVYFSVLGIVANTIFFGRIVERIDVLKTLRVLLAIGVVLLLMYGLLGYGSLTWFYIALTIDMFTLALVPGLSEGLIGKYVPEDVRGEVFGIAQGLAALSMVVGALVAAGLAVIDLRLPFIAFAVACGGAFIVSLRVHFDDANVTSVAE
jgi:MFS transporter, DHA1 family, tetracycline resistance protein